MPTMTKQSVREFCEGEDGDVQLFDAYDFVRNIRDKILSMDQIEKVTIPGDKSNYVSYHRSCTYNRKAGEYGNRGRL